MAQEQTQWIRVAEEEVSLPSPLFPVQQTLVLISSLLELIELTNLTWNCLTTFLIALFCVELVLYGKGQIHTVGRGSRTFRLLLAVNLVAISVFRVFLNKVIFLLQFFFVDVLPNIEKPCLTL